MAADPKPAAPPKPLDTIASRKAVIGDTYNPLTTACPVCGLPAGVMCEQPKCGNRPVTP